MFSSDWASWKQLPIILPTVAVVLLAVITSLYPRIVALLSTWSFYTKRHDFLWSNFRRTEDNFFSFPVLQHSVTAVKGEDARKLFFDNRSLSFKEGYKIATGAVPKLDEIDVTFEGQGDVSFFNRHLAILLRKDRLSDVIPILFNDIQQRMEGWGEGGKFDPFNNIYDLIFQLTVRLVTCNELSSDVGAMNRLHHNYRILEEVSGTPTSVLLPWFPGPGKRNKEIAMKNLFSMLDGYVEKRKGASVPTSDAIDVLLGQGLRNEEIIGFITSFVFVGATNTAINACWTLLYLSYHKEWKNKIAQETTSLIQKHSNSTSSEPLHTRLSSIPYTAWEDEMPILDAVLRETIRLTVNSTCLRRNVLADLQTHDKVIPQGNFMAYSIADVHLNPDIYTKPGTFDPNRFSAGRTEDKKQAHAFLGWGAGRHPCTGMRVAKLEIKIMITLFVAGYEYDIIDSSGKFPNSLPTPDYNDIHKTRPMGESCFLQYRRVVE